MLAEVDFSSGPPAAAVVGLGLNVGWPGPPGAGGTSLEQSRGSAVDPEAVLNGVLEALAPRVDLLDEASGRADLAEEQRRPCAARPARVLKATSADGEVTGTAQSIDDAGQLVVATPEGLRMVAAGDVVHLRAEPGGPVGGHPECLA